MNNRMFVLMTALIVGCAYGTLFVQRALGWPYWTYYGIAIVGSVVLYVVNVLLIQGYIGKRAPEFASTETVMPGTQAWELTAGTGVVPKWVSWIGLASTGFLLAIPFELVAWLMRTLF